jgi:hypothetical protein
MSTFFFTFASFLNFSIVSRSLIAQVEQLEWHKRADSALTSSPTVLTKEETDD